uniref:Uncharacterized protein n=1 Tax=Cacopsylla melanoneura TaxID=428564 RepID=A0A8D8QS43_9HEMI
MSVRIFSKGKDRHLSPVVYIYFNEVYNDNIGRRYPGRIGNLGIFERQFVVYLTTEITSILGRRLQGYSRRGLLYRAMTSHKAAYFWSVKYFTKSRNSALTALSLFSLATSRDMRFPSNEHAHLISTHLAAPTLLVTKFILAFPDGSSFAGASISIVHTV